MSPKTYSIFHYFCFMIMLCTWSFQHKPFLSLAQKPTLEQGPIKTGFYFLLGDLSGQVSV